MFLRLVYSWFLGFCCSVDATFSAVLLSQPWRYISFSFLRLFVLMATDIIFRDNLCLLDLFDIINLKKPQLVRFPCLTIL